MESTSSDAVWWYLQELSSRVVAETGIVSDRYHLGKILFRCFKDAPDFIMQINGDTDERITFKTAMARSILCATAFTNLGLKQDDVIVVMAVNHSDLCIPMYAALYLGIAVAGVDAFLGVDELAYTLKFTLPKVIFCENSNVKVVEEAVKLLNISPHIVTLDDIKQGSTCFKVFVEKFSDSTAAENFRPADFDSATTNSILAATSGSTGLPKAAELTHKNIYIGFGSSMLAFTKYPTPFKISVLLSPVQWVSALFQLLMSPILRFTRVQTPLPYTRDHVYYLINKYKPEFTVATPTFLISLLKPEERHKCDFTSFKYISIGGSAITTDLLSEIKKVAPNIVAKNLYGQSECSGPIINPAFSCRGSLGILHNSFQYKLIDPATNKEIFEPNTPGELYLRGPTVVKGYYNNPEMTAQAFEDGWFKTGDILYRDEFHHMYFVERLKSLLKYKTYQVSPLEIENVIIKHPDVLDVAVTGIPDDECGDLPIAFVIRREGSNVSEQTVQDLVKASLTDTKQLRGGVVFVKELPVTATAKIDRMTLKKMAADFRKMIINNNK